MRHLIYGISGDESGEEVLTRRTSVSAVKVKNGTEPVMSEREHERWLARVGLAPFGFKNSGTGADPGFFSSS